MAGFSGCFCFPLWVVCKCDFKSHLAAAMHAGSVEHPDLHSADWVFGARRCRPVWVAWLMADGRCAMLCYTQRKLTNTISLIMAGVAPSASHACVFARARVTDGPCAISTPKCVCDCVNVFWRDISTERSESHDSLCQVRYSGVENSQLSSPYSTFVSAFVSREKVWIMFLSLKGFVWSKYFCNVAETL